MKRSLIFLSMTLLILCYSCHKETAAVSASHSPVLGVEWGERTIEIDQAVTVYDSTNLRDSAVFFHPPTDHVYQWTISPDDTQAVFSGNYKNGVAQVFFKRSGSYQLSAQIYDTQGSLIGHTDTTTIMVTADTLYPAIAVQPNDELSLGKGFYYSDGDSTFITCILSTLKAYPVGYQFQFANNDFSFIFSDSLTLPTWPTFLYNGEYSPVEQFFYFSGIPFGATQSISFTWLNKTYTGSITTDNSGRPTINWDNSGASGSTHDDSL